MFWGDIKHLLIDSLNEGYHEGELSTTQKRGIISLLYKKNDKSLLNNLRPNSLLNTDYKVLAHILANRLKRVISHLINSDQSGFIKGRTIATNIRLIPDVIDKLNNDVTEGAAIFIDFKKAFDSFSHTFLNMVLKKFNFGTSFIKWVNTINNGAMYYKQWVDFKTIPNKERYTTRLSA